MSLDLLRYLILYPRLSFFIMLWFLSVHSLNAVVYIPLVKTQKWVKVHYIHLVVGASNLGTYYIELLHCTSLASLNVRAVRIEEFPFLVLFWVPLFLCTLLLTSGELSILWKAKLFSQNRIWQWMTSLRSFSVFGYLLTAKKHDKRVAKKMTFVELTSQKKFGFTKNDSGMGILKKTSKRKGNFFRMKLHELTFHYKSHLFVKENS